MRGREFDIAWRAAEFDVDDVPGMLVQFGELMDRGEERRAERLLCGVSQDEVGRTEPYGTAPGPTR